MHCSPAVVANLRYLLHHPVYLVAHLAARKVWSAAQILNAWLHTMQMLVAMHAADTGG